MLAQQNQQCSTAPILYFPLVRLKRGKQNKSQKPNQKETFLRDMLACFSNIWGHHIKTGFHKSQGTEIRRTDWSTLILIQLMNAHPENNRGCAWDPLKKSLAFKLQPRIIKKALFLYCSSIWTLFVFNYV